MSYSCQRLVFKRYNVLILDIGFSIALMFLDPELQQCINNIFFLIYFC